MGNDNIIDTLHSLSLFKPLNQDIIQLLANIATIRRFNENEPLFYEKENSEKIYYLANGSIKFYKVDRFESEVFLYKLQGPSFIFDTSKLFEIPQISCFANAEFLSESKVIEFKALEFKDLLLKDQSLAYQILQESFCMISRLQCIISRDIVFDGMAKVAHMIDNDLETFNASKKHEIAYMLHIQPETLSRILKKLVRYGIIEMEKTNVIVLDNVALRAIYE